MEGRARTRRAVFLDRDGTIIEDTGYPHRPEDLRFLPGAIDALRKLQAAGYLLIIVTNQSGVARGYFPESAVELFHALVQQRLAAAGVELTGIYYCPFHPTEGTGHYRRESSWRKPHPGMLLHAAREHGINLVASVMIGDKPSDVAAGEAAGCKTVLLPGPRDCYNEEAADFLAPDLCHAAAWVLCATQRHAG